LKLQIEMRYKLNGSNWSAFIIHGPERRTPSVVDVVETWGVVKSSTVESALALDGVRDVMERTAFGDRWHRAVSPEEAEGLLKRWRHRTSTLKNMTRQHKETVEL
jgi:hypothetical protein